MLHLIIDSETAALGTAAKTVTRTTRRRSLPYHLSPITLQNS